MFDLQLNYAKQCGKIKDMMYSGKWYNLTSSQKGYKTIKAMILTNLTITNREISILAGGITELSMETFMSASYYINKLYQILHVCEHD